MHFGRFGSHLLDVLVLLFFVCHEDLFMNEHQPAVNALFIFEADR